MSEHLSLIEFIRKLLWDSSLQHDFTQNPEKALESVGLAHIDAHDVKDALTLVHEDSPEPQHHDHKNYDHKNYDHKNYDHDDKEHHAPAPHHHESAAEYVNRYIKNTFVDHRETNIDNSFHQNVDTHGGDFDQDLDVHPVTATGAGAVAAGGDIRDSTITTGDGNQVGDGNVKGDGNVVGHHNQAVTGDHNTTGFGAGNVTSTDVGGNVHVGDGSAFASGGSATVNDTDNSKHDVGNTYTDNSAHNSHNDSSDHSINHSFNSETDQSIHDSGNTHVDTDVDHSFNDNSDNSLHLDLHH